jgi:hypothetical protein
MLITSTGIAKSTTSMPFSMRAINIAGLPMMAANCYSMRNRIRAMWMIAQPIPPCGIG